MGLETSSDTQLLEADATEDWTELSVNYTIPENAPAASWNEENAAETTGMGKVILIVVAVLAAGAAGLGLWKSKKGSKNFKVK